MHFLIATGIFPPEIGGPATVMSEIVKKLRGQGYAVHIVTYGEREEKHENLWRVSRRGGAFVRYWRFSRAVRGLLASDTVVVCTDVFSVGIPVRLALTGKQNQLFIRLGGEWCYEDAVTKGRFYGTLRAFWGRQRLSLRDRLMRHNYAWILKRSSGIYLTSELLREIVARIVPSVSQRMTVVSNIVRPLEIGGRGSEAMHRPLRLLYVGRFAPVKNVPFFARVVRGLHAQGVDAECTFVGDGYDFNRVKNEMTDLKQIEFLGTIPPEAVHHLLSKTDILVLPSLTDICPNVVLEALAAHVPCVITSEHGLGKLTGVIELDPQDGEAWVRALKNLAEPENYEKLRREAALPEARKQNDFAAQLLRDVSFSA